MGYKNYYGYIKLYIVVYNIGYGTAESNFQEIKPVAELDTYDEAVTIAQELFHENNSLEDINSTWCYNTYQININTLNPIGLKMYENFKKSFNK